MRLFFVAFYFTIFLISACSQQKQLSLKIEISNKTVEFGDTKLTKDSIGRIIYENQLFSGFLVQKDSNHNVIRSIPHYQGLIHGDWIDFFVDGSMKQKRSYLNGEKHGSHHGWYESGQLKFEYFFENGLSIGNHKAWYHDGSLYKDLNYKDGHEFGSQKMYRPDGKLRSNYVVRENGRAYGLAGLKRCSKIDGATEDIDPYTGKSNE